MSMSVVDNLSRNLASVLVPLMADAEEVRAAVAFVSQEGLRTILPSVQKCLQRNGRMEFLVGLDLAVTEPAALWELQELSNSTPRFSWYCLLDLATGGIFHPKLYIMEQADSVTAVIGSSNLTAGGLSRNAEVNVAIRALPTEEIVSDLREVYAALKFHRQRVVPDEEFLTFYQNYRRVFHKKKQALANDKEVQTLRDLLRRKMLSLSRPTPTMADLSGWQRLVLEHTPEGEFTTRQMCDLEGLFKERYPTNNTVREKVRQVLQQLRDLGLLQHIKRGTWQR